MTFGEDATTVLFITPSIVIFASDAKGRVRVGRFVTSHLGPEFRRLDETHTEAHPAGPDQRLRMSLEKRVGSLSTLRMLVESAERLANGAALRESGGGAAERSAYSDEASVWLDRQYTPAIYRDTW